MPDLLPTNPPNAVLYPVLALDSYLRSFELKRSLAGSIAPPDVDNATALASAASVAAAASNNATTTAAKSPTNATNPTTTEDTTKKSIARKKNILRVTDFLFGSSILEAALSTLDSYITTEIQAVQSRRRIFVLTNTMRRHSMRQREEPLRYFCLLPNESHETKTASCNIKREFYFCSCRSYFERTKSLANNHSLDVAIEKNKNVPPPQSHMLCKHLLALKLRPFLLDKCQKVETVTEEQFSQEVLKILF